MSPVPTASTAEPHDTLLQIRLQYLGLLQAQQSICVSCNYCKESRAMMSPVPAASACRATKCLQYSGLHVLQAQQCICVSCNYCKHSSHMSPNQLQAQQSHMIPALTVSTAEPCVSYTAEPHVSCTSCKHSTTICLLFLYKQPAQHRHSYAYCTNCMYCRTT